MRKVIISLIVVGLVIGAYFWVSEKARVNLSQFQGVKVKSHRGDLDIPITASGNIEPASVTEIKSKASGEVIAIPFNLGAMVKKGQLVVQLLDVDEQNSVDRARADDERAKIELEKSEIAKDEAILVGIPSAEAKKAQADARLKFQEWNYERQKEIKAQESREGGIPASVNIEFQLQESQYHEAQATTQAAEADVNQAKIAVRRAEKNIATAQQNKNTTQKALDDAMERLRETKVNSPIDGMVLERNVQKGEVIQGGKTMFTGGTVLMKIADVSYLYAVVNVDEADIGQVRELAPPSARPGVTSTQPATMPEGRLGINDPVEMTVESFKDEKFHGLIERIAPQSQVVQAIAKFKVWVRITSDNRGKLVGLLNTQTDAHFTAKVVKNAVLVNYDAMQKNPNGDDYGVFLPDSGPKKFKFHSCKFGDNNGIDVEVIEGLQEGEEVFTRLPLMTNTEKEAEEKKDN